MCYTVKSANKSGNQLLKSVNCANPFVKTFQQQTFDSLLNLFILILILISWLFFKVKTKSFDIYTVLFWNFLKAPTRKIHLLLILMVAVDKSEAEAAFLTVPALFDGVHFHSFFFASWAAVGFTSSQCSGWVWFHGSSSWHVKVKDATARNIEPVELVWCASVCAWW